ncbi:MAG: hypothetical protein AAFU49_22400 [Pseudomonadota bacterium]
MAAFDDFQGQLLTAEKAVEKSLQALTKLKSTRVMLIENRQTVIEGIEKLERDLGKAKSDKKKEQLDKQIGELNQKMQQIDEMMNAATYDTYENELKAAAETISKQSVLVQTVDKKRIKRALDMLKNVSDVVAKLLKALVPDPAKTLARWRRRAAEAAPTRLSHHNKVHVQTNCLNGNAPTAARA